MSKDILKERYKRHNEHEHEVLCATIDSLSNLTVFDKNNNDTIVQQRIKRIDGTGIFLDADNGNFTAFGNIRKTEILVANKKKGIFVEVKHQNTVSNTQDTVLGEIARASNIDGQYWLVLLGQPYRWKTVMYEYVKAIKVYCLEEKVRIFTSKEEYKAALLKEFI